MNEQLAELGQYLGHLLGGALAFSLVRFTGAKRVIAMIFGICLAIGV